ncbi:MAG: hypothetical protein SNJ63_08235 [Sphingomonadaceae bacterium]
MDWYPVLFQHLQDTDMGETLGAAAAEHKADPRRLRRAQRERQNGDKTG